MHGKVNPVVIAVVVTYNRLLILREAMYAIDSQTIKPEFVVIIDNGSTDGTKEWLEASRGENWRIFTQPNLGSAGGFARGIEEASQLGCDWIWIMDDDSIPQPKALENLLVATDSAKIGWVASNVLWTDGTPHPMNTVAIRNPDEWTHVVLDQGWIPAERATFVSVMIRQAAVKQCGLPVSEIFIWGDDWEYTGRILRAGWIARLALRSIVVHKTSDHISSRKVVVTEGNLWKYRYGWRNRIYLQRIESENPIRFASQLTRHLFNTIDDLRRSGGLRYVPALLRATIRGLFWHPRIRHVQH